MSDFEVFTDKGGRFVSQKTLSLSMNNHGILYIPKSVNTSLFDGDDYIQYHVDPQNNLLALEGHPQDEAPAHAYLISGDSEHGSVICKKVLEYMGKSLPEGHTMFELQHDEDTDLPYIDVSKLPEVDDGRE